MSFLLDTNVVSEIRHPEGSDAVKRRVRTIAPDSLFLSVIVFAELTKGVLRLPKGARKQELLAWLGRLESVYGDRILPFDREAGRLWGKLAAESEARGTRLGVSDGQIAATAIQHGMILVTRNRKHFESTGAQLWNPWESDWPC
jgi:predicted nucleic acid-binding protein